MAVMYTSYFLRLRDTVESAIIHDKIHFTTKHVCCACMLASYLTAVQISHLLKPHCTLSTVIMKFSRPASHGCLARGVACSRTKNMTEGFDDYLTWSESMTR